MPTSTDDIARPIAMRGTHEAVLRVFGAMPRGRVLDAGAGEGALSASLLAQGHRVRACDAAEVFRVPGIEFRRADLTRPLPYPDASFDAVAFVEVIEHLEDPFAPLREFARVLAPGGRLVLSTPNFASLERRLLYLVTGNLPKPRPFFQEDIRTAFRERRGAPHIAPVSLPILAFALESLGFAIEDVRRNKAKRAQALLWPLAALLRLYGRLWGKEGRRLYRLDLMMSAPVLMGGNTIIVVARKSEGR